ncbi:MAG: sensor histidine kinase, partial [Bacteroidota bacterium]
FIPGNELFVFPNLLEYSFHFLSILLMLSMTFTLLFTDIFLNLQALGIKLRKAIPYWIVLNGVILVAQLILLNFRPIPEEFYNRLLFTPPPFTLLFCLLLGIIALRNGYVPARFYLLSFSFSLVSASIYFISVIIGQDIILNGNAQIIFFLCLGSVPILFALAMGNRTRILEIQREEALLAENKAQNEANAAIAAEAAAKEADLAKTAFLNTVSHELRTPLTSILGFARLNKRNLEQKVIPEINKEADKAQKAANTNSSNLDIITSEGQRLTDLINELLDLAKIESGKVDWKIAPQQPRDLVDSAIHATTALFAEKSELELIKEIPDDLPMVMADKDRIQQVLINLISNAVKFTNSGHIKLGITESQDHKITTYIEDTGSGIPSDQIEKIFERFQQVEDNQSGKPKGTGLGLPICKEIVEYHGGEIWVESRLGEGSTFYFTLLIVGNPADDV